MAYWQPINYKSKKINRSFADGINSYLEPFDIKDSELTFSYNMCSDDYPAIRTRNDRGYMKIYNGENISISGNLLAYGKRSSTDYIVTKYASTDSLYSSTTIGDQLHILDGNTWKYAVFGIYGTTEWVNISTSMSTNQGTFINFNTEANRYTILLNPSTERTPFYAYNGTDDDLVSLTTNAPNTYLYTVHRYRVFGVEQDYKTIKYSAIGTCTDWTSDPGINSGSFVLTQANSAITAITTYQDHVIIWTKNSMHELYGYEPLNFTVQDITLEIGCISQFGFAELDGVLYFVNNKGVYAYSGGMPKLISQKISNVLKYDEFETSWDLICSIVTHNKKLYFMFQRCDSMLVYDTEKNVWHAESSIIDFRVSFVGIGNFFAVGTGSNVMYNYHAIAIPVTYNLASGGNNIVSLDTKTQNGYDYNSDDYYYTQIQSHFVTKAYNDFAIDSEVGVRDVSIKYSGSFDAAMNIQYSTKAYKVYGETFNNLVPTTNINFSFETQNETQRQIYQVPTTSLQNCAHYRIKFNNTGHVKVNSMQLNCISYGGDL